MRGVYSFVPLVYNNSLFTFVPLCTTIELWNKQQTSARRRKPPRPFYPFSHTHMNTIHISDSFGSFIEFFFGPDPADDPTSNAALRRWLILNPDKDILQYPTFQ